MINNTSLRPERPDDEEFIYSLYASTRAAEMARTGWSDAEKEAFLRSQMALQMRHYRSYFASSAFDVILESGTPIGRFYVERATSAFIIHDITISPGSRRKGIGSQLIMALINEADMVAVPVQVFVEQHNPAMSLYNRLGFVPVRQEGIYFLMERSSGIS